MAFQVASGSRLVGLASYQDLAYFLLQKVASRYHPFRRDRWGQASWVTGQPFEIDTSGRTSYQSHFPNLLAMGQAQRSYCVCE